LYIKCMLDLLLVDMPRDPENLSFVREPAFTEGVDVESIAESYDGRTARDPE
jgi:hypothetical protein